MPELPEVEYARRQLARAMAGARITGVLLRRANLRYPFPADFLERVEGQTVRAVTRRAKYLLLELASGDVVLMHLGMSGSFNVIPGAAPHKGVPYATGDRVREDVGRPFMGRRGADDVGRPFTGRLGADDGYGKHDHVVFEMSNGKVVVFTDPRRFGFMTLHAAGELATHKALGKLGPEPLAREFTAATLAADLARRKTSLKIALSDQRVIGGLGNIYVVEALHLARLSPKRRASTLVTKSGEPRPPLHDLVAAIRTVLKKAIKHQYRTGGDDPFLVYDHEGERCPRRGCHGIIKRIVQGGRSTFYCPVCQK